MSTAPEGRALIKQVRILRGKAKSARPPASCNIFLQPCATQTQMMRS